MEEVKKIIRCNICKATTVSNHLVTKYFNLEEYEESIVANGCENCKNYADLKENNVI